MFPELSVTSDPCTICATIVSILVNAPMLYLASEISVVLSLAAAGPALVERSSSPCTQVNSGTMMGNTSLYCPVATLIRLVGETLAGMSSGSPAMIASVTIPTRLADVVYAPVSAVMSASKY